MLRDRLVCGVNNRTIQTKLLSERDLNFSKAFEIALALELANENMQSLSTSSENYGFPQPQRDVNFVKGQMTKMNQNSTQSQKKCYRCNGHHNPANCKFKESKCFSCGKIGHLASACRSKKIEVTDVKKQKSGHNHKANVLQDECDSDFELFTFTTKNVKPFYLNLNVNDKMVKFQLDTGASLTIMSKQDFNNNFNVPLKKSEKRLKTYTGEIVNIVGELMVTVTHNGSRKDLSLLVVDGCGPSLVGRDWIRELKLEVIFNLDSHKEQLGNILEKFSCVFDDSPGCVDAKVKIHLKSDAIPKFRKARSPPYALRQGIEEELERLQRDGVIVPVEHSEWATPIVPILKKDKSIRICGDFKTTVNAVSQTDNHPIPLIEDLALELAGGQKFSKIDFSHAYTQLTLDDDCKALTTLNTHKGLFMYQRLCFGLSAAPGIFQRIIEGIFKNVPCTVNYLDDLYVTGASDQEHLENLEKVFEICKEKGLTLKKEKCSFLQEEVSFLGFKLSRNGLKPIEEKVLAVKNFPPPTDKHLLKSFLGLINYYGKFIRNLATILAPLYNLLHKGVPWVWKKKEQEAFDKAKSALSAKTLLSQFDPNKEIVVTCDASPVGVGAILSQIQGDIEVPIAFASRRLQVAERNYAQIDREALSIIFAVRKWHKFLSGNKFTIITDHKPLLGLFGEGKSIPEHASARVQRWAIILSAYTYTLQFKPGMSNEADILSRLPLAYDSAEFIPAELEELFTLIEKSPLSAVDIAKETQKDSVLKKVYSFVKHGWLEKIDENLKQFANRRDELSVDKGCLLWGVRVIIPQSLQTKVMGMLHDTHIGMSRMKAQARSWVWWPGIDSAIETAVRSCYTCQVHGKAPPKAPLFPWEWPKEPWSRVHIDFAGPFLGKMFLVIVDAHSKWVDIKIMSKITAQDTVLELRDVFSSLGVCSEIVSDNGPTFTSDYFRKFLSCNGIKHITVSPYHPSSNGLAERYVQEFKSYMVKNPNGSLRERVAKFLTRNRSIPHSTTGLSPFELMYGRKMRTHLDLLHPNLYDRVAVKQSMQKWHHDQHTTFRDMGVGDSVLVRNFSTHGDNWVPGTVSEKTGTYSYQVSTPSHGLVRRHIDHVKKATVDRSENVPDNTTLENETSDIDVQESNPSPVVPDTDNESPQCSGSSEDSNPCKPVPLRRSTRLPKPVRRLDL